MHPPTPSSGERLRGPGQRRKAGMFAEWLRSPGAARQPGGHHGPGARGLHPAARLAAQFLPHLKNAPIPVPQTSPRPRRWLRDPSTARARAGATAAGRGPAPLRAELTACPGLSLIPSALRRDTGGESKPLPRVRVPLRAVPCLFRAGNTLSSPWPFRFPPQPTTPGEGPAAEAPSSRKRARGELCPGHAPCPKTRGPSPPGLSLSSGRFQEPTACPTGTVCSRIPSAVHSGRVLLSVGAASRSPQPRLVAEGRLYL